MTSHTTAEFWQAFNSLPDDIQQLAKRNYSLWCLNPQHSSIRFKYVGDGIWSARVGLFYRALAVYEEETVIWYWIGHHSEYDQILRGK